MAKAIYLRKIAKKFSPDKKPEQIISAKPICEQSRITHEIAKIQ